MAKTFLEQLAMPGVTALVCFLSYTSQWPLFHRIEPGPLTSEETYIFNILVAFLLICYFRTCFTDPAHIPKDWAEKQKDPAHPKPHPRWCRKCDAPKPPRAHHCKTCERCIMKMDHHCVWTANCVSHRSLPHFVRFLLYAVAAMIYLETFLYTRAAVLWHKRHLPSYLGPSVIDLAHLFMLIMANSVVLFALVLLFGRTIWSLALNMTTIESWEIERHEAVARRARVLGGYLDGPDGSKIKITHQEFPWDIGIWTNICSGMGSQNPLAWFWPFSASPPASTGISFPHNEIDDPNLPWPPPDPDRMYRATRMPLTGSGFTQLLDVGEFRKRQAADIARYEDADGEYVVRRRPFHERLEAMHRASSRSVHEVDEDSAVLTSDDSQDSHDGSPVRRPHPGRRAKDAGGEEAWRNKEGERLADFGVDEVADFYDEDDLPLSELQRRLVGR